MTNMPSIDSGQNASRIMIKGAEQEEVVRAIQTVASGGAVFGAALALRIAEFFAAGPPSAGTAFPS